MLLLMVAIMFVLVPGGRGGIIVCLWRRGRSTGHWGLLTFTDAGSIESRQIRADWLKYKVSG